MSRVVALGPVPVYYMSMDIGAAEVEVRRLAEQLIEQRELAESATRKAAGLGTIIRGYIEMFPELEPLVEQVTSGIPLDGSNTPRGAEAVRLILQGDPGRWWLVTELVEALKVRGWMPDSDNPANAVRTALERLIASPGSDVRKGRHDHDQSVVYGYTPDWAPPTNQAPAGYDPTEEPF